VRQDENGFNRHSSIQLAAFYGDEKMVELLLSERASGLHNLPHAGQMRDALVTTLNAGHSHVVLKLLDRGMDLNFLFSESENLQSPLEWAIKHGDLEQVKLFLDKGANAANALMEAVKKGKPELVEVLV
jgi:ankyrin repeat protein